MYHEIGKEYVRARNYTNSFEFLFKARDVASASNNLKQKAQAFFTIGQAYYRYDNSTEAIKFMNKALIIPNGLDAEKRMRAYSTLGNNYSIHGDFKSAIAHYKNAIGLKQEAEQLTGKNYNYIYNNIALSYGGIKDFNSAKFYHNKCLQERLNLKDTFALGQTFNNLGTLNYELQQYDSALYFFEKGLAYRKMSPDPPESSIIESEINVGKALVQLNNFKRAESILRETLKKSEQTNNPILKIRVVEQLALLSNKTGNYKNAYLFNIIYHTLKDSLFSVSQKEDLIRLATETEFEEKILKDSLVRAERQRQNDLIVAQEKKTSAVIKYSLFGALILVLGIMGLIYRNFRNSKKSAAIIFEQKELAEAQKKEIDVQHKQLQATHKEITDSIAYAKRIQGAILPPDKVVKEYLKESFVLYKPKDVVAGDFYWLEHSGETILFAAADCTGHGVPGAMVSVVCNNGLNRSVREYGLTDPGKILDKTRDIVIQEFEQSEDDVKDGMDIALCALKGTKLLYAGAHNPLWIIRKGEIIETKANKQPIGQFDKPEPYKTHEFELEKGDTIYVFSDGYVDQFGGEKGKKFKASSFKALLLSIQDKSMEEQRAIIDANFENWKGSLEQIDDVCVIGVRVV